VYFSYFGFKQQYKQATLASLEGMRISAIALSAFILNFQALNVQSLGVSSPTFYFPSPSRRSISRNKLHLSPGTVLATSGIEKDVSTKVFDVHDITNQIVNSQYIKNVGTKSREEIVKELESVIKYWGRKKNKSSNERCELILSKLEEDESTRVLLNSKMYNIIMNQWIDMNTSYGNIRARKLMDKMHQSQIVKPDTFSYTSIIRTLNSADEAKHMLHEMVHLAKAGNVSVTPNTVTYNSVLRIIAHSGEDGALESAEEMLTEMERVYKEHRNQNQDSNVIPNTISYTTLINAYANSSKKDAALDAQRIFKRMQSEYQEGNIDAEPNVLAYNTYIKAWVNSRKQGNALQAERILMDMIQQYKEDKNPKVKPNVISFSTVISGWAKSNQPGSEVRAAKVFNMMMESYKEGNKSARPNVVAYSSLIDAYIKTGNQKNLEFAEYIYNKLCKAYLDGSDVQPTVILANQIMDAWSRSVSDESGERAERILNELEELSQKMKNSELQPTTLNYTTAINVWAKSSSKIKAVKARDLFQRMIRSYESGNENAKPTVFTYTAVLNACAFCTGGMMEKKEALQIATSTFKHLESFEFDSPNHITYNTFLRVCLNLIPVSDARDSAVSSVFDKCKQKGFVTEQMFQVLQNAYPNMNHLERIIGWQDKRVQEKKGMMEFDDLPLEWKLVNHASMTTRKRNTNDNSTTRRSTTSRQKATVQGEAVATTASYQKATI
jgi:hypothetical protein